MNVRKYLPVVILIFVLFSIYITLTLTRQRQEIREEAAPATTLRFNPGSIVAAPGATVILPIEMTTGINQIAGVELHVAYDPTKFDLVSFEKTAAVYEQIPETAPAGSAVLNVLSNPAQPISGTLVIANLTLQAKTGVTGTESISFTPETQAAAIDSDISGVNALTSVQNATVDIIEPSPTPTPRRQLLRQHQTQRQLRLRFPRRHR